MNGIQQIYCTHCTYGTSALDHREGDFADRTLGYSARASSLDHAELRKYYRAIERFLSYYLPIDTPAEEKLRLTAAQAPKRLIYHPDFSGLQFLAQVCYRDKDTAGRPGSYFGHVLLSERGGGRWDVLNCLRLWGANWVAQDSPSLPLQLPVLGDLEDLSRGAKPALCDRLLLSFLTARTAADFDDPSGIIPPRWKQKSAAERTGLLADVLQNYLESGCGRKESVILVVEPEVAAVLFYGVARLLPTGNLRNLLSFSTFEPSVDRLSVLLAATTFHFPDTTDLRPDAYRGRGWVHNSYLKRSSERPPVSGVYGRVIVERLLVEGWESVDSFLADVVRAGCASPADLESVARVQRLAPALLSGNCDPPTLETSPVAAAYLAKTLRDLLAREEPGSARLIALRNSPRLLLLDLLACDARQPVGKAAIEYLLAQLPEPSYAGLLASRRIDVAYKVAALGSFLRQRHRFPADCDLLWETRIGKTEPAPNSPEMILAETLASLPGPLLESLINEARLLDREALWLALARASGRYPQRPELNQALGSLVDAIGDDILCGYLRHSGRELGLAGRYPRGETVLPRRLQWIYESLPTSGSHFLEHLEVLETWSVYVENFGDVSERLPYWRKLRDLLLSLQPEKPQQSRFGGSLRPKAPSPEPDAIAEQLAKLVNNSLMPFTLKPRPKNGPDDAPQKLRCLREIGAGLLGGTDFFPEATWQKIDLYFQGFGWSKSSAKKTATGLLGRISSKWTFPLLLLAATTGASIAVMKLAIRGYDRMAAIDKEAVENPPHPRPPVAATTQQARSEAPAERRAAMREPATESVFEQPPSTLLVNGPPANTPAAKLPLVAQQMEPGVPTSPAAVSEPIEVESPGSLVTPIPPAITAPQLSALRATERDPGLLELPPPLAALHPVDFPLTLARGDTVQDLLFHGYNAKPKTAGHATLKSMMLHDNPLAVGITDPTLVAGSPFAEFEVHSSSTFLTYRWLRGAERADQNLFRHLALGIVELRSSQRSFFYRLCKPLLVPDRAGFTQKSDTTAVAQIPVPPQWPTDVFPVLLEGKVVLHGDPASHFRVNGSGKIDGLPKEFKHFSTQIRLIMESANAANLPGSDAPAQWTLAVSLRPDETATKIKQYHGTLSNPKGQTNRFATAKNLAGELGRGRVDFPTELGVDTQESSQQDRERHRAQERAFEDYLKGLLAEADSQLAEKLISRFHSVSAVLSVDMPLKPELLYVGPHGVAITPTVNASPDVAKE